MQLNQTIDLNVALIKPIGTVVGRVLTSDGITPPAEWVSRMRG